VSWFEAQRIQAGSQGDTRSPEPPFQVHGLEALADRLRLAQPYARLTIGLILKNSEFLF
jgi:hypothetical protein